VVLETHLRQYSEDFGSSSGSEAVLKFMFDYDEPD
jgi:hypothetical protein